ncbi:transmembrane protein [Cystoisospora suis]|uniref:Transmembrane protein n=1 Tax=Cystoisospora suis TaxID=483139 RepID=A0A2C6KMJ1_9APIC|nr:transmembrane protein [Cystoisospora suis]
MKDQGAVHTAEELQCEVQEDERKNESPQHTRNDKKMLSPKEEENGKDKIETQQEEEKKVDSGRDAIGDSPMSMQEYLDKGYRLVFNTPYRVDEMIRLKGLKDGMDLSTDEQEDEKDVGDIEEDDEDDIFK